MIKRDDLDDARIEQIRKEADQRIARMEAESDERLARARAEIEGTFTRLEAELVQARERAGLIKKVSKPEDQP